MTGQPSLLMRIAHKLDPIAIIKGGQTIAYEDFLKSAAPAPSAEAPKSEPAKDAPKAEAKK